MYLLTLKQVLIQGVAIAVITACLVITYFEWVSTHSIPLVVSTQDNKCIKVLNFNNGDAFQCADVDIVLRKYRKVVQNEQQ